VFIRGYDEPGCWFRLVWIKNPAVKFREVPLKKKGFIKNRICFIGLLLALLCPVASFAEVTMSVTPNGYGSFLLVGENVVGVAALDITIDYDSSVLANPRVDKVEGGTVTEIDAGAAGKLHVGISRENPNAAFYLMLRFENPGRVRGKKGINSVIATGRKAEEDTSPAPDTIDTPFTSSRSTRAENKSGNDNTAVPTNDNAAVSKAGGAKGIDEDKRDYQIISNRSPETTYNIDKTTYNVDKWTSVAVSYSEKSVLQRFMEFKGEKSLQAFAALFKRGDRERAIQYPSIALSDGKTLITIKMELQQEEPGSPDIAVWDATLVSLRKDGGKNWVASVVPSEGAWEAKLILKVGSEAIEVPLVVAPRIELDANVSERNFLDALDRYCSDQDVARKWENVPHLNDYIFTANYLADSRAFSSKKEPR
jgi:hypothetical protein